MLAVGQCQQSLPLLFSSFWTQALEGLHENGQPLLHSLLSGAFIISFICSSLSVSLVVSEEV